MSELEKMLAFNKVFVEEEKYEAFASSKFPDKKMAILSCMDTRLTKLLPAALNLKNGDIKVIKNAGAVITHPFGSVMRSLLIAVYNLDVEEIVVIGHRDCGMQAMNADMFIEKMKTRGIHQDELKMIEYCGIDLKQWLSGFDDPEKSIKQTVEIIKHHPLLPKEVRVCGFLIDPHTGHLEKM